MKRALTALLSLALLLGTMPARAADRIQGELQTDAAGLQVTWYPQCDSLIRRYGTDRMLLTKDGKSGLFGLDGAQYTGFVFDAVGEFDPQGRAPAMKGGRWGRIDLEGSTVTDFLYETAQEAADQVGVRFVSRWGDGSPPYALAGLDGTLIAGYGFWSYDPFSNGFALVSDGENGCAYIDETGRAITPFKYGSMDSQFGSTPFGADGFAIVQNGAGLRRNVIDRTGRELLAEDHYKVWRAGLGLFGFSDGNDVGFIDGTGKVVIPPRFCYYTDPKGQMRGNVFDEATGLAQVWDDWGSQPYYIDVTGAKADTPEPVDENAVFHEGLVWENPYGDTFGMGGGQWGFRDRTGSLAVPYRYDAVGHFDQGYASVRLDGVYGLLKNPLKRDDTSPWAAPELAQAREAGCVTGRCETYQTYTITRLQFAELAVNYLEKATGQSVAPAPEDTFTDTADEAVLKAYAAGIVQGVGAGRFDPHGPLTREQLAAMLWRAMERAGVTAERPADLSAYADGGQVSAWAADGMAALIGAAVLEGTGENDLSPKASCTVEQAILLTFRAAQ